MNITLFTPTYNRAKLLPFLYNSLINQTSKNFEWLIVDDGSTDNTRELVEKWIKEKLFPIRYIYQNNGGKMRAHNRGVLNASYDLFMCIDSDDYLYDEHVVEDIQKKWEKSDIKENISGIIAYRKIRNDGVIATEFPTNSEISTLSGLYENGFQGDTALVFRTDILKQYLFPEIADEKFITEAFIYEQMDLKYKMLLLRKPLMMCEYQEDGYSMNFYKSFVNNPRGWALYYNQCVQLRKGHKRYLFVLRYISASLFVKDNSLKNIIQNSFLPYVTALCIPVGYLLFLRVKRKSSLNIKNKI